MYIYGKKSVYEAIKNNLGIEICYVLKENNFSIQKNIPLKIVDKDFLNKISKNKNHQGIAIKTKEFNYYNIDEILKESPSTVLVLDHIEDPHNLGAIIRSANAFGVKYIIIPKERAAKITPSVLKVALGGQIGIKIIRVSSLLGALTKMKNDGYWVYASSLNENSQKIQNINLNNKRIIVVGRESTGVSKTILNQADEIFYIPMQGIVQSLNVSVATGIILYSLLTRNK